MYWIVVFIIYLTSKLWLCQETKNLTLMHLTTNLSGFNTESILDFATSLINERNDILPDYQLQFRTYIAEPENVGESVKGFIDGVSEEPVKCAIFGPFYSSQAKVVAETASFYNLVEANFAEIWPVYVTVCIHDILPDYQLQFRTYIAEPMGFSTSSPILSDIEKYPYFARTYASSATNNMAILKILEHFKWGKIASMAAADFGFVTSTKDQLISMLPDKNISILSSTTYTHEPVVQMEQIRDSNARIIIAFTQWEEKLNRPRVMCEAYKMGLKGRRFQWLDWSMPYGVLDELNAKSGVVDDCTREQILEVIEGMFTFGIHRISDEDFNERIGVTGMTARELNEEYQHFLSNNSDKYSYVNSVLRSTAFDGVWALALAMNETDNELKEMNSSMAEFTYESREHAEILFSNLISQTFFGQGGKVSFDVNGDSLFELSIYQIRRGEAIPIADYSPFTDEITWLVDEASLFVGGRPPLDADLIRISQVHNDDVMFVAACILACAGILYAIVGSLFTFYHRNTRYIKMSSPRINYIIATGCIFIYIAVILWGIDNASASTQKEICQTRVWLLVCGFTFAFGSMFSKTWRVHKIVTTKTLQKKIIKDLHLMILVLCMLAVDFVILILWQSIDPLTWKKELLDIEEDEDEDGIVYQKSVYSCTSNYGSYWSGSIYVIKGLLLIFGSFFAWQTRKIQIEGLNDSKHIGISVYNIMIASILTVPLVNILSVEQSNIIYGVTVISMLVCSTITITLVFGTKMYNVLIHGNKVEDMVRTPFEASLKTTMAEPSQFQSENRS